MGTERDQSHSDGVMEAGERCPCQRWQGRQQMKRREPLTYREQKKDMRSGG